MKVDLRTVWLLIALATSGLAAAACEDKGPLEEAADELEDAVDEAN